MTLAEPVLVGVLGSTMLAAATSDSVFIDPSGLNLCQLSFLAVCYGYILLSASNQIADGSELLLLVPSISGLVGSVVLPFLGAVPDGLMVLFSGVGADAENTIGVGMGTLVGSSIMLLTLPWFMSIMGGRVNLDEEGEPTYRKIPKLTPDNMDWYKCGVGSDPSELGPNGRFMMISSLTMVVLTVVMNYMRDHNFDPDEVRQQEFMWYVGTGVVAIALLFIYLWLQMRNNDAAIDSAVNYKVNEARVSAIKNGTVTLRGCISFLVKKERSTNDIEQDLLDTPSSQMRDVRRMLYNFFHAYDLNGDHKVDKDELSHIMKDLGEYCTIDSLNELFERADTDNSGFIEFDEFVELIFIFVKEHSRQYFLTPQKIKFKK